MAIHVLKVTDVTRPHILAHSRTRSEKSPAKVIRYLNQSYHTYYICNDGAVPLGSMLLENKRRWKSGERLGDNSTNIWTNEIELINPASPQTQTNCRFAGLQRKGEKMKTPRD
ncbi:hypothetical protein BofuT4_P155780.1 [Botrytis cinerea T4]|uniref:Uncharacterized protein n=1 Tax=Botryotinia fuckeliana (strain T4) TaxID=999810 RepID=G2YVD9_BOTF4|nr:hypothetical protein BofuT4_P155780.1 [Botrytis cinerea T4]